MRCSKCFTEDGVHVEMDYNPNPAGPRPLNKCKRCGTVTEV